MTLPTPNTERATQPPSFTLHEITKPEVVEEESRKNSGHRRISLPFFLPTFQHFKTLVINIGVTPEPVDLVTDRVFNGDNYRDSSGSIEDCRRWKHARILIASGQLSRVATYIRTEVPLSWQTEQVTSHRNIDSHVVIY
jgi:hypothetical protein